MEKKYTQGKWIVHDTEERTQVRSDLGEFIADCTIQDPNNPLCRQACRNESIANANLIAVAPELLQNNYILLETVAMIEKTLYRVIPGYPGSVTENDGSIFDLRGVMAKVQRLIDRAEGK